MVLFITASIKGHRLSPDLSLLCWYRSSSRFNNLTYDLTSSTFFISCGQSINLTPFLSAFTRYENNWRPFPVSFAVCPSHRLSWTNNTLIFLWRYVNSSHAPPHHCSNIQSGNLKYDLVFFSLLAFIRWTYFFSHIHSWYCNCCTVSTNSWQSGRTSSLEDALA